MRKLIESYNNGYGPGNGGNGNGAPGSGNNGGNGNNSNGGNGNGSPKRPSILMLILSGLMTVIVVLMLYNAFFGTNTGTEVSYTDFLKDLEADKVAAVEVNKESGMVTVQLKQEAAATPAPGSYVSFYGITQKVTQSQTVYYTMLMEDLDTLTARLQEHDVQGNRVTSNTSNFLMEILVTVVLPVVLIWIVAGFCSAEWAEAADPWAWARAMPRYMYRRRPALHSRMWPVKTKQRNLWWKSWTSCIIHRNIPRSVQNCPREHCWWALPEPVRLCWPRQWQEKHMYRSSL